ncbi:MAG: CDP-alcohol phosphatidyltransferase family protein [Candidatus Omnitrophica bacterium]|nr:CDP-alcohol phosphatidyltransferase family protein [Candidatus Omnitrophota bacterium]
MNLSVKGVTVPSIYNLKPAFQNLMRPVMFFLHDLKITPNGLTLSAVGGSICVGFLMTLVSMDNVKILIFPVWLFIRMALNALDGMMAREFKLQSRLGLILNEIGDLVSDAALFIPFLILCPSAEFPILFFILGGIFTEFCGLLGPALKAHRHYEGPMGKSDRAFFTGLLIVIVFFYPATIHYWKIFFAIAAALTLVTCLNRLTAIWKEANL